MGRRGGRSLRQGQRARPRDDRRARLRARPSERTPRSCRPRAAQRPRHGPRAARSDGRSHRSGPLGRGDPACADPSPLRRPHPRRRGDRDHEHPVGGRATRPRRSGERADRALRDAGLRPGAALSRGRRGDRPGDDGRAGAAGARGVLVRRQRARVLRTHDRARLPRRALPAGARRLGAPAAAEPTLPRRGRRPRLAPVGRRGRRGPAADPPPDAQRRRVRVRQSARPTTGSPPRDRRRPTTSIRTKRLPLLDRDVDAYAGAYRGYFERCASGDLRMLDPAPRVVLDPLLGLCTVGASAAEAGVTADIYRHTIEIIERAELLESWQALPEADIFAVEYWDLEQAKLAQPAQRAPFAGEVALVTGAASGIGRACAEAFLLAGAAVCGLDLDERVGELSASAEYLGLRCDVTSRTRSAHAFETLARAYGGLDMLVLSRGGVPGLAPGGRRSTPRRGGERSRSTWTRTSTLLRLAHPWLKQAPGGGRVVIIGSKNVPGARRRRRRLLGVEGGSHAAGASERARMGSRRHPRERRAPERRLRHRPLDRGGHPASAPASTVSLRRSTAAATSSAPRCGARTWPGSSPRCAARRSPRRRERRSRSTAGTSG